MIRGFSMKKLILIIIILLISSALFAQNEGAVTFHNFAWGTSIDAFKARVGNPLLVENTGGFQSLLYENVSWAGHRAFMIAYFSQNGLEGGMYYFNTIGLEEMMKCYNSVQKELVTFFGPTPPAPAGRYEELMREMRAYESCWMLPTGYIHLKVNTRTGDPVTLWISFPALTAILDGA